MNKKYRYKKVWYLKDITVVQFVVNCGLTIAAFIAMVYMIMTNAMYDDPAAVVMFILLSMTLWCGAFSVYKSIGIKKKRFELTEADKLKQ